jgi:hypothetical protein
MAATLILTEAGCNAQRRRAIEAAPTVVAEANEALYLGALTAVEGYDVLRGELHAPSDKTVFGSGGYGGETRNVLYLDGQSTQGGGSYRTVAA